MEKLDLIERYLQFIRFWLPKKQRDEIVAELSDDLYTQVEERESELGHSLTEDDVVGILKRRGSPVRVAAGFLPKRLLIGPVLFPVYVFVLKLGLYYIAALIAIWAGMVAFSPDFRAQHLGVGLVRDCDTLWHIFINLFGLITLVFAVIERVQSRHLGEWDPRKLPKTAKEKFRTQNIVDLVFNAGYVVVWAALGYYLPNFENRFSLVHLDFYYWSILALSLVNLAQQITNVARPEWQWLKPATLLTTTFGSLLICLRVMRLQPLMRVKEGADSASLLMAGVVNQMLHWFMVVLAVSFVIACAVYGFQLWKAMKNEKFQ